MEESDYSACMEKSKFSPEKYEPGHGAHQNSGSLSQDIDPAKLPAHVAIIMDGNGRWAQQKGVPRTAGHKEGIEAAKRVIIHAISLGIPFLTLYVFSTENWKRPALEVNFLMKLIVDFIKRESDFYRTHNIHLSHSGDLSKLPKDVIAGITQCLEETVHNTAITVNLALNYGGRDEIVRSVNRLLKAGTISKNTACTEHDIAACLDNPDIPDPDLIIRTAGEVRISNYLLWQSAYSELHFSPVLWPDWGHDELAEAVKAFQQRKRKFGGVK